MNNNPRMHLDHVDSWRNLVKRTIEKFLRGLPLDTHEKLDYSLESLDVLEAWLLKTYPPLDSIPPESDLSIHDGVMYYIGEVYREHLGGHWNVHFAAIEPNYRYGEEPVIEGFSLDMAVCPFELVRTVLRRRKEGHIGGVLRTYLPLYRPKKIE